MDVRARLHDDALPMSGPAVDGQSRAAPDLGPAMAPAGRTPAHGRDWAGMRGEHRIALDALPPAEPGSDGWRSSGTGSSASGSGSPDGGLPALRLTPDWLGRPYVCPY
jgi:hypothetical protein